ncbi:MAG TPA: hypothetical protein V6C65_25450 [Allocoleopsis sp.]
MSTEQILIGALLIATILVGVLFIVFGQFTVKRLRKNPNTRHNLGMEYISGWNILNVAQALALPKSWTRKLENGPLSSAYAKTTLLIEHTTKFDRALAFVFYWLFVTTGLSFVTIGVLDSMGYFHP